MRVVGLHIDKGHVAAAVVEKRFRKAELVDSFSITYTADEDLLEILREKAADWADARIIASIPGHRFTQRVVHFPFSDRKHVEKALPFELEDAVPFEIDDMVVDHLVLSDGKRAKGEEGPQEASVLGMVLPKPVLRQHLELLASAGIDPQVIVPSYLGLYAISRMLPAEGCTLFISNRDLCVKCNSVVKGLRSFSPAESTAGVRHTLQALEIEHKERVEKAFLLSGDSGVESSLAAIGIPFEEIMPELGGNKAEDALSLGLALSDHANFRKGEFAFRVEDEGARRKKLTLAIAAGAAAVLFVVNMGVKYYIVRSTYGRLDREIHELYRKTFPEAKTVQDPVREMRDKLQAAKKKFGVLGSGSSALDVMKAVTEGIPKEVRVNFFEFRLEGERLKLRGEAQSFEAVDKVKAELEKAEPFAEVVVKNTRMGVENKVKFRMEIKVKQEV